MNVIVTGATGFLGYHLVRELLGSRVTPVCIKRPGRLPDHLSRLPVSWQDSCLADYKKPGKLLSGAGFIFHCAAQPGTANTVSAAMWRANVELPKLWPRPRCPLPPVLSAAPRPLPVVSRKIG